MTKKEQLSGLKKFEIIAPLLSCDLEAAQKRCIRHEIMQKHDISDRTLRRYLALYEKDGIEGISKAHRADKGQSRAISEELLAYAVDLRKELPSRSTRRIIEILEGEGLVKKGTITVSTLNRNFVKLGATRGDVKKAQPARRFQKLGRNALWQADIKYGPYLQGKDGKKHRTYLMVIFDDATRMPIHTEFYENQKLPILEDSFRKGLLKFGVPDAVYIDNGKIFISQWFRFACARLNIRHTRAKPYSPSSKGKVERFNGRVDEFIEELSLVPKVSLAEINRLYRVWLDEGYIHQPHSSLNGKTPHEAWEENTKKVRFISNDECRQAFLWEETRKVDKTGAVKLKGRFFDAGTDLINKKVDLRYDPLNITSIDIWHNGVFVRNASELVFSEYLSKNTTATEKPEPPGRSRLLDIFSAMNGSREQQRHRAISFTDIEGGGEANV